MKTEMLHFLFQLLYRNMNTVRQVAKAGESETIGKSGSYDPPAGYNLASYI
jgi:hypothetical protein